MADTKPNSEPESQQTAAESIGGRLVAFCEQFEVAWKSGKRPSVRHYLERWEQPNDSELLRELLRIDLDYRRLNGDDVTPAEYESSFPDQQDVISEAFATTVESSPTRRERPTGGASSALQPGDTLGDYVLLEELGRGGMGVVFRAKQQSADRVVALKVIGRELLGAMASEHRDMIVERFKTEARAAARLEHDHLVTVYEVGESDGQHYYSMRYVQGRDLSAILQDGPLKNEQAAEYLECIARGMQAAHDNQILHRDLKPANILVDVATNRAMVTDFGLARLQEGESTMTQAHDLLGTPSYVSPEQATSAKDVTEATDVYGLGATLYHLITGRAPFHAATRMQTIDQVKNTEPVAPRTLNPDIDLDLETICLKCLEKEPRRRYASAQTLAEDLSRYLKREPILARPVGPAGRVYRWGRRNPVVATLMSVIAAVLVLGVMVSTYYAIQANERATETEAALADVEKQKKNAEAQKLVAEEQKQFAETQQKIAEKEAVRAGRAAYNVQIARVRELVGVRPEVAVELLEDPEAFPEEMREFTWGYFYRRAKTLELEFQCEEPVTAMTYTLDGDFIITGSPDGKARQWNAITGEFLDELDCGANVLSFAWLNKDVIAIGTSDGVVLFWNFTTGKSAGAAYLSNGWNKAITFSPNGQLLAVAANTSEVTVWDVPRLSKLLNRKPGLFSLVTGTTLSLATAEKALIQRFELSGARSVTFSPDGQFLAAGAESEVMIWATKDWQADYEFKHEVAKTVTSVKYSPSGRLLGIGGYNKSPLGQAVVIEADSKRIVSGATVQRGLIQGIAWSPNGRQFAQIDTDGQIHTWKDDLKGKAQLVGRHPSIINCVEFAPNSQRIATADKEGRVRLWRVSDASLTTQLAHHQSAVSDVVVAKKGSESGSVAASSAGKEVVVWTLPNGEVKHRLSEHSSTVHCIALNPTGTILAAGCELGDVSIWDLHSNKRELLETESEQAVVSLAISPNGKLLAVGRDDAIAIWNLATRKKTAELSAPGVNTDLQFSPQGDLLASVGFDRLLKLWNVAEAELIHTFSGHEDRILGVAFSPSGDAMATVGDQGTLILWDVARRIQRWRKNGSKSAIVAVAFSPDGKSLATGGYDWSIHLWDPNLGQKRAEFKSHLEGVTALTFTPDGSNLISGGIDRLVKVWKGPQVEIANSKTETKSQNGPKLKITLPSDIWPEDAPKLEPLAEFPAKLSNSIEMKLALIPAGKFQMGSKKSPAGIAGALGEQGWEFCLSEFPRHEVIMPRRYYMSTTEITRGQFKAFTDDTGYLTTAEVSGGGGSSLDPTTGKVLGTFEGQTWRNYYNNLGERINLKSDPNLPIAFVSWKDATAFCEWLSKKENARYRLPTEAEWEYACRAGTDTFYWCGDDYETLLECANVPDASFRKSQPSMDYYSVKGDDGYADLAPVGSFKPNPWGLYDMHGNVWEYCLDGFDEFFYYTEVKEDPIADIAHNRHVTRGGCFM